MFRRDGTSQPDAEIAEDRDVARIQLERWERWVPMHIPMSHVWVANARKLRSTAPARGYDWEDGVESKINCPWVADDSVGTMRAPAHMKNMIDGAGQADNDTA